MPADASMNDHDEDDMEPMTQEDTSGSGEPDDSPVPSNGGDSLDIGKGKKNANGTLASLGAGSVYKGRVQ